MNITQRRASVLGVMALAAFVAVVAYCSPATPHEWYDYLCCNKTDCRPTQMGEVRRQDDGWFIVPTGEVIPFSGDSRLKQSQDPMMHRCLYKLAVGVHRVGDTRCLYVATPGG